MYGLLVSNSTASNAPTVPHKPRDAALFPTNVCRVAGNPHNNVLGALAVDDTSSSMPMLLPKAAGDLESFMKHDTISLGDQLGQVMIAAAEEELLSIPVQCAVSLKYKVRSIVPQTQCLEVFARRCARQKLHLRCWYPSHQACLSAFACLSLASSSPNDV